jgi:phage gpG-like protein
MQIHVEIKGAKEVRDRLKRTADGVTDLREPLSEGAKYLVKYYSGQAFVSQGGVFGARWPRLSPAYEARKLKKWGARPTLVASGRMQRSFDYEAHPMQAEVTNTADQFKYHQSSAPRRVIPRRQMMGVNPAIEREVNRIVNAHVREMLRRA